MQVRRKQVVVIGSSGDSVFMEEACKIGEYIARLGCVLISGGRGGIMEAASRGASGAGGLVVGILPGDSLSLANRYCDIVIPTGMGYARNVINVLAADVIVSISGGYGTLSELAYAAQFKKPVICCSFSGGWSCAFPGNVPECGDGLLWRAGNLEEVFALLDALLTEGSAGTPRHCR